MTPSEDIRKALDDILAESSAVTGRSPYWSNAERIVVDAIVRTSDQAEVLRAFFAKKIATADLSDVARTSSELRQLDRAVMDMHAALSATLKTGKSAQHVKAANTRWSAHRANQAAKQQNSQTPPARSKNVGQRHGEQGATPSNERTQR